MSRQSHIPVIVEETLEVAGSIPLYEEIDFTGTEATVTIGGYEVPLFWLPRQTVHGLRTIATVRITMSEYRRGKFPVYFQRTPQFYFPQFFAERSVLHWGAPPIPDYWLWVFTHGETKSPTAPGGPPGEDNNVWTIEVPMLSSADCAFVDVDWTQFVPGAVGIQVDQTSVPSFMQLSLISQDMSQTLIGLTQAEATPTLRMYRIAAPTAGSYDINMDLVSASGVSRIVLRTVVV